MPAAIKRLKGWELNGPESEGATERLGLNPRPPQMMQGAASGGWGGRWFALVGELDLALDPGGADALETFAVGVLQ
jgi:hypothetical protein